MAIETAIQNGGIAVVVLNLTFPRYLDTLLHLKTDPCPEKIVESPNTDMLLRDLLLITHHYTQSNSKTS